MNDRGPRSFQHPSFPKGITVYPKDHEGVLNYGLDVAHYHAPWDGLGATSKDPHAGFFPTLESVTAREGGGAPRDGLGNIRGGMTGHVRVVTLNPGKHIFRFAQHDREKQRLLPEKAGNVSYDPFCGPWWTSSLGFENMLARVSATYENSAIGVAGGRGMKLREYARRYSAVFSDWSRMEIIGMCRVLKPIRAFMGMGAKLTRTDVKVTTPQGIELLETETYDDSNIQLYIPNLWGQIGTFLSPPQVWTPEQVDQILSRRIQAARGAGTLLSARKKLIVDALMGR